MNSGPASAPTERLGSGSADPAADSQELPYTQIGPFELLRQIGSGGMGRVYLATQSEPIRRQVALKLMAPNFADTLAQAMFLIERQALANLAHPHIAQVLEAGQSSDGTLYFAMEWVDGVPINRYCAEQALSLAQTLQLVIAVCRGIQHAHARGVIHRDLKPANILIAVVDGKALPKIIDFGIATAPGTGSAAVIGTPGYMSPEQADPHAVLDQRADVYALGVLTLELLSRDQSDLGTTWLNLDAHDREHSLTTGGGYATGGVRAIPRSLPADLRAVLAMAVRSDRNQRYSGAEALAEDLQRFLERRPVMAVGQHSAYLLRKFIQRHRFGMGLASLALLTLMALLFAATLGWRQAEQQALRATRTAAFLQSVLEGVDPRLAKGRDTTLLLEILEQASKRVDRELDGQPTVRDAVARTIAASYAALGDGPRALAMAEPIYQRADQRNPSATETLQAGDTLLSAYRLTGQVAQANALAQSLYQRERDALGPLDTQTLRTATLLLRGLNESGALDQARNFSEARLKELTADVDLADSAQIKTEVAQSFALLGDHARALALTRDAMERLTGAFGAADQRTMAAQAEYATSLFRAGDYVQALREYQSVLPDYQRIFGDEHPETLSIRGNIAACLTLTGHPADAAVVLRDLVAIRERINGEQHPETLIAVGNLATALFRSGQHAQARTQFERYLTICNRVYAPDHPSCAERRAGLGKTLRELGLYAEAETELRAAYDAKRKVQGQQFAGPAKVASELATLYERWQRPDEARSWAAVALAASAASESAKHQAETPK